MTSNRILAALVEARALLRSEGNPNHDALGKFAHGPGGGHGKHHARRQRRKNRLQRKVKAIRTDRAEMKARHKAERQDRVKTERSERKSLRQEHHAEHKSLARDQAKERREMDRDHARELRREKDPEERTSLAETHGLNLKEQGASHRQERQDLRAAHKEARADQATEHRDERQNVKEGHRDERREWAENVKDELRDEFPKRKGKGDAERRTAMESREDQRDAEARSTLPGSIRRAAVDHRRFGSGRTAKASSAEAILRHCLRQRGWTGQYARGALSGRQRLRLLEDVRRYARNWLRHEAEAFFREYGQSVARGLTGAMASHVGRFFQRVKSFVHEAILAGSLVFSRPDEALTEDDMRFVDQEAEAQTRYLNRFEQEVVSNPPLEIAEPTPVPTIEPMTAKQVIARAEQYGDAPWGAAQQVNRQRMAKGGTYTMERRIHGRLVDDMCETCSAAVAMGWQPIGTLPRIGDSECIGACHCFFQYQDAQGNLATTVRKSKGKKAPKPIPPVLAPPLPPKPVKVYPVEPTPAAPEYIIGPWVDANGKAITYHYEEAP